MNKRHDGRGMWVEAPLLKACKPNLMPEIVRHVQTLAGVIMDVSHNSDRRSAAVSLIPGFGIQCPKNTLVEKLIRLQPDRDIIGPPMSSITLKTRLNKAQEVILCLGLLLLARSMNAYPRGANAQGLLKLNKRCRALLLTGHPRDLSVGGVEEARGIKLNNGSRVPVTPKAEDRPKPHRINEIHNTGKLVWVGLDEVKWDAGMGISETLTSCQR